MINDKIDNLMDLTPAHVNRSISVGFWYLYVLISTNFFAKMGGMNSDAIKRGRANLDKLADIVKNPEKYLSRETTENAWRARRAAAFNMPDLYNNSYYVESPVDLIWHCVRDLPVYEPLKRLYYEFCWAVMNWYYACTSNKDDKSTEIKKYTERISELLKKIMHLLQEEIEQKKILSVTKKFRRLGQK